jgi:peptidyl-prolyl cis-trans isomerase C
MNIQFKDLRLLVISMAVAGFVVLTACTGRETVVQQQTIAKVGPHELTSKQFADDLAHRLSKYDALSAKDPKNVRRTKDAVLNDFIMASILQIWAKQQNMQVSKESIETEIKSIRSGFPDDFSFREELSKQGLSIDQWQKSVELRLLERTVLERLHQKVTDPSEPEIARYYQNNLNRYKHQEKIFLQQIVVAEKSDADQIQAALKAKKSLEGLAKQFSITPEGKNGGNVGWVEKGTLEIFDKAFALPIGKTSETVQSPYGFHVMVVLKKAPAGVIPFPMVHDSIKHELKAKKDQAYFSAWLDQQIRSVHVFKDQQFIESMSVETRND